MLKLGTPLANTLATALGAVFDDGWLDLFAGTAPGNPDDPITATPLVSIHLPAAAFAPAAGGTIALSGTWFATVALIGTAAWFRLRDPTGQQILIGSVTGMAGAGPLKLLSLGLISGGVVLVTGFSLTLPTGS
ncbi:hypothetical protein D3874_06095 [Oleomonas cavernae]|uniref:Uncharacterized protein n=1 Tax=Oleomonas cavernae TaxID=2320859 RepID=A0A418W9M8_9PROT|nr:hypothetical protein [Oleomonas cavernae]RJF86644.1 hypothetical protein D3874_06095 [Oleomonas cavernae]